ncbi:MAG TPA: alpha/beta fold hydrolase, partial [Candidatus Polarisedimenticolaceae bacterium]|nr:alpha/beta fold hydrolase [Candidatus Polarisedimenticolaceae bacterium]
PRRAVMRIGLITILGLAAAISVAGVTPAHADTFETQGITIWYEVRGSGAGTPLVVANGGPGFDHSYLLCGDVWDRLAKGRKVVFYDQRGNGKSSELKEGQPCGLAEQIDDLDALRAHLGFEKIDLLGHSWGGYLVMAYASRHPERIAHLMIVDSGAPKIQDTVFLFKNMYPETTEHEDGLAFAVELGDEKAIAADLHDYMTMIFYSPQARDAFLARSSSFVYRQKVNKAVWGDLQRFDLNPELPKFKFPTLVVTGRYDFNVAPSVAYAIHKAIPGSDFAVFEKSGHLPFCEEPDGFIQRVEAFLKK